MVLQIEDCDDTHKVLFAECDSTCLFDHSDGHDHRIPDGLNGHRMNAKHGGLQQSMHDSVVPIVGPHAHVLSIGDMQRFNFAEDDDDLFWINE